MSEPSQPAPRDGDGNAAPPSASAAPAGSAADAPPPSLSARAPTIAGSKLLPIFIIVFIDVMGLTLIIPILPFYAQKFGASEIVVTSLTSVFAACQLFSGPFLGIWSDRIGRKPVLLVSQAGMMLSYLVLGSAQNLGMLFAGRVVAGLTAGNLSVAQAYISDVTKPEERTKAFGFFGIAFGLGFILGPVLGIGMTALGNESTPFFGSAVLSAMSWFATLLILPKVTPTAGGGRSFPSFSLFFRPEPRLRLVQFFCYHLSFSVFIIGFPLYLQQHFGFDRQQTLWMYAYSGVLGAVIQGGLLGRVVRRLGEERLAFWGFVTMIVGHALLGWIPNIPVLLVVGVFGNFGIAVTRPALTTLVTKSVGRHEQGTVLGMGQTLASVSQIVGPPAAGWLIQHRHLGAYGLLVAGLGAAGAILLARPSPSAAT